MFDANPKRGTYPATPKRPRSRREPAPSGLRTRKKTGSASTPEKQLCPPRGEQLSVPGKTLASWCPAGCEVHAPWPACDCGKPAAIGRLTTEPLGDPPICQECADAVFDSFLNFQPIAPELLPSDAQLAVTHAQLALLCMR
jgi:hypothetical protein